MYCHTGYSTIYPKKTKNNKIYFLLTKPNQKECLPLSDDLNTPQ